MIQTLLTNLLDEQMFSCPPKNILANAHKLVEGSSPAGCSQVGPHTSVLVCWAVRQLWLSYAYSQTLCANVTIIVIT